jgi:Icc-related predicted phosphoesterase
MNPLKILHISDLHGNVKILRRILDKGLSFDWIVLSGDIAPTHVAYISDRSDGYRKIDIEKEAAHQAQWATNALKPWIDNIPHKKLIIVNGNHDFCDYAKVFPEAITQFKDSRTIDIDGVKVGLAVGIHPLAYEWHEELDDYQFNNLLMNLDPKIEVLITHAPANQVLDMNYGGQHIGYNCLYSKLFGSRMGNHYPYFTNLRLHMFGHAHESNGIKVIEIEAEEIYPARKITFSNAACAAHILDFAEPKEGEPVPEEKAKILAPNIAQAFFNLGGGDV